MEGYKSLREAVASVGNPAFKWTDTIHGNTFSLNELYNMGNRYDKLFPPGEWTYFVTFPTGEIGLLSTDDNEIVLLFVPENSKWKDYADEQERTIPTGSQSSPDEVRTTKARPKFCGKCGSQLPSEGAFCKMCGARIRTV